jgi:hypothetical protein
VAPGLDARKQSSRVPESRAVGQGQLFELRVMRYGSLCPMPLSRPSGRRAQCSAARSYLEVLKAPIAGRHRTVSAERRNADVRPARGRDTIHVTVKSCTLLTLPTWLLTVIGPDTAPAGTMAERLPSLLIVKVAGRGNPEYHWPDTRC